MRILITGGAGFIGSHIVESLVRQGHDVVVYDNFSTGSRANLTGVTTACEVIEGDIRDLDALAKAAKGAEIISHQAAQLEIFKSSDDPKFDLDINTIGTLNVLAVGLQCGAHKVVNASSACIYGQVEGLTPESCYPRPNWAYGVSKLAAEKYADIYNDYHRLPIVHLRYGITYGEREWYRRVLTIFIKRAIAGSAPVIFGDGQQIRDFVYVGDLVRLHNECLHNERANGQAFNAGTGRPTTIKELARQVVAASGKTLVPIHEETPEGAFSALVPDKRRNAQELKTMLLDVRKAKEILGWEPTFSLQEGVGREYVWAQDNLTRWQPIRYTE